MKKWTYDSLKAQGLILFECIAGSIAYGTNTPASDIDKRYIYILPLEDILSDQYVPQVRDGGNDVVGFEVQEYLKLLKTGNPTVIELLNMPDDVIQFKHPLYDLILNNRDAFLTKQLKKSITGFAVAQIKKANGTDKKMNWEKAGMVRKTPLDFCYVALPNGGSTSVSEWLTERGMFQEFCGLTKTPNWRDTYALFYDWAAHMKAGHGTSNVEDELTVFQLSGLALDASLGFKGVIQDAEKSNDVSLCTVPKGLAYTVIMGFNRDGYSTHCKKYKEYQEWLENRNVTRYVETENHGQKIDGKNMLHTVRAIRMSREVAEGKGLIIRRPDAAELLSIRRGEQDLEQLTAWATEELPLVEALYDTSDLPDDVPTGLTEDILLNIRKGFYGLARLI